MANARWTESVSAIAIPNILNEVAQAGQLGVPMPEDSRILADLRLCREWDAGLQVVNGRVMLPFDNDRLVPVWIENETPAIAWDRLVVAGFFQIGSTNVEAQSRAREGAPSALLVYAESQTAGRGRKGRRWESAPREGLYFSLLLRPLQPLSRWPILTHLASVALAQTLQDLYTKGVVPFPLSIDLKWPNDVLLSGKKTAGILLEATSTGKDAHAAIIGVGVNIGSDSVPRNLTDRATAVSRESGVRIPRRQFLVWFLRNLQEGYALFEQGDHARILDQWKGFSTMWNGVPVWVSEDDRGWRGVTCGLTESGALRVRSEAGIEETVLAGDVSIRCI